MKLPHFNNFANKLYSARDINFKLIRILTIFLLSFLFWISFKPYYFLIISQIFLVANILPKLVLFLINIFFYKAYKKKFPRLDKELLPSYTIMIALYKEDKVAHQLYKAIRELDYPEEKKQVLFILEEDDQATINIFGKIRLPKNYQIVIVPHSLPKTKPKALNYAMQFAKGELLVVYDADDIPAVNQLQEVASMFAQYPDIACVQCQLNYYNRNENILTFCFAIEYYFWFANILPIMDLLKMPIPLGGSSNHIKSQILQNVGGWDAYNVTEDCDLGFRLHQLGHKVKFCYSKTHEEAPITLIKWIKERSRWHKGYLITFFVLIKNYKNHKNILNFLSGILFIFVPIFSYLLIAFSLIQLLFFKFITYENKILDKIIIINLIGHFALGYLISLYVSKKNRWKPKFLNILVFPHYFLLHVLATIKSVYEIFTKPFYWDKTEHGVTKCKKR